MKRFICFMVLLVATICSYAQSEWSLRDYLKSNAETLDPIEGVYDVEWNCDYITPFVHQKYETDHFTIIIKKSYDGSKFDVYSSNRNYGLSDFLSITKVGQTNVYYFYYKSSKCRIYLTDNNHHFVAKLQLDNSSAKFFTGNYRLAPSVNVLPVYDCIKTFPN